MEAEPAESRLDALGLAALKLLRAAKGLIGEALDPHDPPSPRFFLLDLESNLADFERLFPARASSLTRAARRLGRVPLRRFGYSATSGHGLAQQIATEASDAAHRILPPLTPRDFAHVWPMVQRALKRLAIVDMEWLLARIIAEQDFTRREAPRKLATNPRVAGEKGNRRRRGSPVINDAKVDAKLLEDWAAAKRQGETRKDFCKARGVKLRDLIHAQGRKREPAARAARQNKKRSISSVKRV
jgi:hypothetical protein